jgi:hypothetical protein
VTTLSTAPAELECGHREIWVASVNGNFLPLGCATCINEREAMLEAQDFGVYLNVEPLSMLSRPMANEESRLQGEVSDLTWLCINQDLCTTEDRALYESLVIRPRPSKH